MAFESMSQQRHTYVKTKHNIVSKCVYFQIRIMHERIMCVYIVKV